MLGKFQNFRDSFFYSPFWQSLNRSQKYALVTTLFLVILLPVSLLAVKYQRVFTPKAAEETFPNGRVQIFNTYQNEGEGGSNPEVTGGDVTSQIVRLQITLPDWTKPSVGKLPQNRDKALVPEAYAQEENQAPPQDDFSGIDTGVRSLSQGAGVGECCLGSSPACSTGLSCNNTSDAGCPRGRCVSSSTQPPATPPPPPAGGSPPQPTPPRQGSPNGANCTKTSDCQTGLVCVESRCSNNGTQSSGPCLNDIECDNNTVCIPSDNPNAQSNYCRAITTSQVGRNKECDPDDATGNGSCRENLACGKDINNRNRCILRSPSIPDGQFCVASQECSSGSCIANVCQVNSAPRIYTKTILIRNENGDFTDTGNEETRKYVQIDLTTGYTNPAYVISGYALSPLPTDSVSEQKTAYVRFISSDNQQRDTGPVSVTLKKIQPEAPQNSSDALSEEERQEIEKSAYEACVKASIEAASGEIDIETISGCAGGKLNSNQFKGIDYLILAWTLANKLHIYPYFAACPYLSGEKLDAVALAYSGGVPVLPKISTDDYGNRYVGRTVLPCNLDISDAGKGTWEKFPILARGFVNKSTDERKKWFEQNILGQNPYDGEQYSYIAPKDPFYETKLVNILVAEKIIRTSIPAPFLAIVAGDFSQGAKNVAELLPVVPLPYGQTLDTPSVARKLGEIGYMFSGASNYEGCFNLYSTNAPPAQLKGACISAVLGSVVTSYYLSKSGVNEISGLAISKSWGLVKKIPEKLLMGGRYLKVKLNGRDRPVMEVLTPKIQQEIDAALREGRAIEFGYHKKGIKFPPPAGKITQLTEQEWVAHKATDPYISQFVIPDSIERPIAYKIQATNSQGQPAELVILWDNWTKDRRYLAEPQLPKITEHFANAYQKFVSIMKQPSLDRKTFVLGTYGSGFMNVDGDNVINYSSSAARNILQGGDLRTVEASTFHELLHFYQFWRFSPMAEREEISQLFSYIWSKGKMYADIDQTPEKYGIHGNDWVYAKKLLVNFINRNNPNVKLTTDKVAIDAYIEKLDDLQLADILEDIFWLYVFRYEGVL